MSKVIMGDESWVYIYGPETKTDYSQWMTAKSLRFKKVFQSR